jgi:PAS domain-containing protein
VKSSSEIQDAITSLGELRNRLLIEDVLTISVDEQAQINDLHQEVNMVVFGHKDYCSDSMERYQVIIDQMMDIAALDFPKPLEASNTQNMLDGFAEAVNQLAYELEARIQKLQSKLELFDQTEDFIFVTDTNYVILESNPSSKEYLGIGNSTPTETAISLMLHDANFRIGRNEQRKQYVKNTPVVFHGLGGKFINTNLSTFPIYGAGNKLQTIVFVARPDFKSSDSEILEIIDGLGKAREISAKDYNEETEFLKEMFEIISMEMAKAKDKMHKQFLLKRIEVILEKRGYSVPKQVKDFQKRDGKD